MTRENSIILAITLGIGGKIVDDATWDETIGITIRSLRKHHANFDAHRFRAAADMARTTMRDAAKILTH